MMRNDELRMRNDERPAVCASAVGRHSSRVIRHSSFNRAFSLIECLAYMAVFSVVLGVALAAYYRMDEQARAFSRNSDDIIRTMQAGERWRTDVRLAAARPRVDAAGVLHIPLARGEITYAFRDAIVWRTAPSDAAPRPFLIDVRASAIQVETRPQVQAWRWELELATKRTNATVRPLFTFITVPTAEGAR
jgi:type II secretory pathway pseudopilin PulG